MKLQQIVIFGTWKEAAQVIFDINASRKIWEIAGILDENLELKGRKWHDIRFLGGWSWAESHRNMDLDMICCIGRLNERMRIIRRMKNLGFNFPNLIHPTATISHLSKIGEGNLICANTQIHPDVTIGSYNMLNVGTHVAHDVRIGSYCNINSYCTIVDKSIVKDMVYLGACATVIKGVTIGKGSTVGASALVNKDVRPGTTVAGVPAREMKEQLR